MSELGGKRIGDFDVWYEPCTNCGYDTGRSEPPKEGNKTCWKCGHPVKRDFSERALKQKPNENKDMEEEKYHIGFYVHGDGSPGKVKGNWKTSAEDVDEEANSHLYKNKLGLVLESKGSILKSVVEQTAREQNMSVGDVLSCV
jgi:hypothetical protein